jgi:hypothetical protein
MNEPLHNVLFLRSSRSILISTETARSHKPGDAVNTG